MPYVFERVCVQYHHVGQLARLEGAEVRFATQGYRAIAGGCNQNVTRRQSRLCHQFEFAMQCRAVESTDIAGVTACGDQHASGVQPRQVLQCDASVRQ